LIEIMEPNNLTHTPIPTPGWQMLGELELPAGGTAVNTIHAWLTEILAPLNLSLDFFTRVLQSAQASASRELQQTDILPFGHIHLSIFTPHEQTASQRTWGFFHTERAENEAGSEAIHIHRINYFLYVEGD